MFRVAVGTITKVFEVRNHSMKDVAAYVILQNKKPKKYINIKGIKQQQQQNTTNKQTNNKKQQEIRHQVKVGSFMFMYCLVPYKISQTRGRVNHGHDYRLLRRTHKRRLSMYLFKAPNLKAI